jgi:cobalamin synthase
MEGKYIFLICFVAMDVAALIAYLFVYLNNRDSGRPFAPTMKASYPLLIVLLILVPAIIVFEHFFKVLSVVLLFLAFIAFLFLTRITRISARGESLNGDDSRLKSFHDMEEDEQLPFPPLLQDAAEDEEDLPF